MSGLFAPPGGWRVRIHDLSAASADNVVEEIAGFATLMQANAFARRYVRDSVERCRPVFEAIGRRAFEAGPSPVAATAIKIANNFVLGCAIEAMGEGFSLVRKYGVVPAVFQDVMTDGLFAAVAYKIYGKIIVDESYDRVGQMAVLGLKDANLALAAGEAAGVPLPSGNVWRDRLVGAIAHGDGGKDWAVMALEQARASGLA